MMEKYGELKKFSGGGAVLELKLEKGHFVSCSEFCHLGYVDDGEGFLNSSKIISESMSIVSPLTTTLRGWVDLFRNKKCSTFVFSNTLIIS